MEHTIASKTDSFHLPFLHPAFLGHLWVPGPVPSSYPKAQAGERDTELIKQGQKERLAREAYAGGRSLLHHWGFPTLRVTCVVECCTQLSPTKQRRQDRSLFRTIIKSLKGQFLYPPEPPPPPPPPPHPYTAGETDWERLPGNCTWSPENEGKIKLKLAPARVAKGCGLGWSFVCLHVSFGELTADRGRSLLGLLCPDSIGWRVEGTPRQSLRLHSQSRRGYWIRGWVWTQPRLGQHQPQQPL